MNDIQQIGARIAELRKSRGVTQEELAAAAGVSAQAVSKWERGGVPDVALLPAIADFFDVSIDTLFGREGERDHIQEAVFTTIQDCAPDERPELALELCWMMEKALCGTDTPDKGGTLSEYDELTHPRHSAYITDAGMTQMRLNKSGRYFFLLSGEAGLPSDILDMDGIGKLFARLAESDFREALLFLYKRQSHSFFTEALLCEQLGLTAERAHEVMEAFKQYHLLWEQSMELNDRTEVIYLFKPNVSFVGLLLFAQACAVAPQGYTFYHVGRGRPYIS